MTPLCLTDCPLRDLPPCSAPSQQVVTLLDFLLGKEFSSITHAVCLGMCGKVKDRDMRKRKLWKLRQFLWLFSIRDREIRITTNWLLKIEKIHLSCKTIHILWGKNIKKILKTTSVQLHSCFLEQKWLQTLSHLCELLLSTTRGQCINELKENEMFKFNYFKWFSQGESSKKKFTT